MNNIYINNNFQIIKYMKANNEKFIIKHNLSNLNSVNRINSTPNSPISKQADQNTKNYSIAHKKLIKIRVESSETREKFKVYRQKLQNITISAQIRKNPRKNSSDVPSIFKNSLENPLILFGKTENPLNSINDSRFDYEIESYFQQTKKKNFDFSKKLENSAKKEKKCLKFIPRKAPARFLPLAEINPPKRRNHVNNNLGRIEQDLKILQENNIEQLKKDFENAKFDAMQKRVRQKESILKEKDES